MRFSVGSPFPTPDRLLLVAKDVGYKEGVVPLYILERLGAEPKGLGGNRRRPKELGLVSRRPGVGETEGSQERAGR